MSGLIAVQWLVIAASLLVLLGAFIRSWRKVARIKRKIELSMAETARLEANERGLTIFCIRAIFSARHGAGHREIRRQIVRADIERLRNLGPGPVTMGDAWIGEPMDWWGGR